MKKISLALALFLSLSTLAVAAVDDGAAVQDTATVVKAAPADEGVEPQETVEPPQACDLASEEAPALLPATVLEDLLGEVEIAYYCIPCGCQPGCCWNKEHTLCLNGSGGICRECT